MNTFKDYLVENRIEKRRAEVDTIQKFLGDVAEEHANDFDNYNDFKRLVLRYLPELEEQPGGVIISPSETGPIHIDLQWLFNNHNTVEQERQEASWGAYAKERAAGEHVGRGGWTGD